jgi:hypothetical protein
MEEIAKDGRFRGMPPRPKSSLLALVAVLVAAACVWVTPAGAASLIEGVWSFNGGQVAIHPGPNGTLVGTVVSPTMFAQCTHEVGETMWTEMVQQENEPYYWGWHQWLENGTCARSTLGRTAWRVMEAKGGGHYLLVCFSSPVKAPENPVQPKIAPNGEYKEVTYSCYGSEVDSAHVAPLPGGGGSTTVGASTGASGGVESFSEAVSLPSNKQCLSRRLFQIHLKDPKYDPLKEVVVTLGHRRLTVKRHGNVFASTIDLRGLPSGRFTIKIDVTTVLGHHLSGSRTYHTCAKKSKAGRPAPLRSTGRKHG